MRLAADIPISILWAIFIRRIEINYLHIILKVGEASVTENIKFIIKTDKEMSNGMRDTSGTPLSDKEIAIVISEIKRIKADITKFVINDPEHFNKSTCYNYEDDVVYVTRNVFPDLKYSSAHPRDIMSIAAVLAHEYYGHRPNRKEYLEDDRKGDEYHSIPLWKDEVRASLTAAQTAPGLTQQERKDLINDAAKRSEEAGLAFEYDDWMKEIIYGYTSGEKAITGRQFKFPRFVSLESTSGTLEDRIHKHQMPEMRKSSSNKNDRGR